MLRLTIPERELWDEANQEFVYSKAQDLQLEHSLVSVAKWESRWCKPFLSKESKTYEETIDYVRCMTLTQNVDPKVYYNLTNGNVKAIDDYIEAPMTATYVPEDPPKGRGETVTAELIYYWMIALNIPMECQKWHLNRLLMLIKTCNFKNKPKKKMSRKEILSRNAALNDARRRELGTKG